MKSTPVQRISLLAAALFYGLLRLLPSCSLLTTSYLATYTSLWVLCAFFALFYHVLLYHRWFSPLRHLPSAKGGSWWNGQAKRIYTEGNGFPASEWLHSTPHKHMFRYLGILNSERIVVTSPEALAEICTRNYDFPKSRQATLVAGDLLGRGLVLTDGDEHKQQRKMLLPSFSSKNIRALYPVFWSKAQEVTAALTTLNSTLAAGGGGVEIGEWASRAALDVITLAALGLDFGAIRDPNTPLNKAYRQVFEPTRLFQFFSLLKLVIPSWVVRRIPIKQNLEIMRSVDRVRETCRQLVRAQRDEIARKDTSRTDLLSHILRRSGTALSEAAAVDQMMTFLAAGHETVSVGITWAIYMLCRYPEYQTRLRAEIRELAPGGLDGDAEDPNNSAIAEKLLDRAVWLTVFCNEVLRYWPPIPLTAREAAHDTTLQGQFIPQGTKIILTIVGTNRDERLWGADARAFRPERWLSSSSTGEKDDKRLSLDAIGGSCSKYANMSFNHGPRMCIGGEFARAEMALMVAALVGRFEFSLVDEALQDERTIKLSGGGFSVKPMHGLHVAMKRVDGW
ncbi:cytochrome P450 [Aspergillus bertholletiae]|uniref:Cytochrome P450 n=1 Tax=Aspergillus bertholletiae TaxID=1226010 RepID=A0A5N7B8C9_9EURO|nr:cytochrome P450 [Aspergillus bertholletiae]